jgi:hypothetical protein
MALPVHRGRLLDQLRDPLQEAGRRAAVDQPMVEGGRAGMVFRRFLSLKIADTPGPQHIGMHAEQDVQRAFCVEVTTFPLIARWGRYARTSGVPNGGGGLRVVEVDEAADGLGRV